MLAKKQTLQALLIVSLFSSSHPLSAESNTALEADDKYLWLEDVDGKEALSWVNESNQTTSKKLQADPLYDDIYNDVLSALNSDDKLPEVTIIGDYVYQLTRNLENPRGLYQRTSLASFKNAKPEWQTVLDIDQLSKVEGVKWVFHGMDCFAPDNKRCLVFLSPGGGDAHEMREFNLASLAFVENGFYLPSAKMQVSWLDQDTCLLYTSPSPRD